MRKCIIKAMAALTALVLLSVIPAACAYAENTGKGTVSREMLSAVYRWLYQTDRSRWDNITYDQISSIAGKRGAVIGTDEEDYRSAYWTDGMAYVTVTFRNAGGTWVVRGLAVTGLNREEYENADLSLLKNADHNAVMTESPSPMPTEIPTEEPTPESTEDPTEVPTEEPTPEPTVVPTEMPTEEPTPEQREPFDLSFILEHPHIADGTIRVEAAQDETGNTYIYNNYTAEELSFAHPYESDRYYSYADFDIVITATGTQNERPILRLWISLITKDSPVNIQSITFVTGGKEYTFSSLMTENSITQRDDDYEQTILIRFDKTGLQFLEDLAFDYLMGESSFRVVFHGKGDFETEMGEHFWDVFSLYWDLYNRSRAADWLEGYEATPMTVSPLNEIQ